MFKARQTSSGGLFICAKGLYEMITDYRLNSNLTSSLFKINMP